jgi:hypothetical protein
MTDFDYTQPGNPSLRLPRAPADPVAERDPADPVAETIQEQIAAIRTRHREAQADRRRRKPRVLVGVVAALALAAALSAWLVLRDGGSSAKVEAPPATAATAASVGQLHSLATSLGHPIYWLGPKSGYTYELTQAQGGNVYIRYLPPGVTVGAKDGYLTIATYPFPGAFRAIQNLAKQSRMVTIRLPGGGLAVVDTSRGTNVHLAYPGSGYQVEVYDPSAGQAQRVVASGEVSPVP